MTDDPVARSPDARLLLADCPREELSKCLSPMTHPSLLFIRELAKRFLQSREVEQRVVSKSRTATLFAQQHAFRGPAKLRNLPAILRDRDHAHASRRPLLV